MYKVTLSMPIYNVAPYVERALLSALNQTFDSLEFLIVDDRGTDNSMDIVRKIVAEHPRGKDVRIIEHLHNIGTGATKNTAIDNAQGEYLFFMDSDDEITPDCIEVLYKAMMEEPVDFIVGSYIQKDGKGKISKGVKYIDKIIFGEYSFAKYIFNERNKYSFSLWNKLYDLDFLKKNKLYCMPHHLSEDFSLFPKMTLAVQSCRLISNVTLIYFIRENSTMRNMRAGISLKMANEAIEALNNHYRLSDEIVDVNLRNNYFDWLIRVKFERSYLICVSDKMNLKCKKEIMRSFFCFNNSSMLCLFFSNSLKLKIYVLFELLPIDVKIILLRTYNLCK